MARDGPKDKPAVTVLIVAYESGAHLGHCLGALKDQTFAAHEVVMVDNASTDGAPQAAATHFPHVRQIPADKNLGFAAGTNLAAHHATGDWLALINPDAIAALDWLERLMAATTTYPAVECFTSRQLLADGSDRLDGLGDVMSISGFPYRGGYGHPDPGDTVVGEVFSACGGAMLIRRDLFEAMGGFDECLFCYGEDVDLGYRLRLVGKPTLLIPDAVVHHHGGTASGGPRSDFAAFHGTRNRFWVYLKNTPALLLWLTLPLHILATVTLFARHATRGELAAPWRGLMAGIKDIGVALNARPETQATRTVSTWNIAKAMTWNPLDLLLRRAFIQRWPPSPPIAP